MLDLVDYFNMHNNIFLNVNKNHTTSLVEGNIIKYLCLKSVYIYNVLTNEVLKPYSI